MVKWLFVCLVYYVNLLLHRKNVDYILLILCINVTSNRESSFNFSRSSINRQSSTVLCAMRILTFVRSLWSFFICVKIWYLKWLIIKVYMNVTLESIQSPRSTGTYDSHLSLFLFAQSCWWIFQNRIANVQLVLKFGPYHFLSIFEWHSPFFHLDILRQHFEIYSEARIV